MCKMDVVEQAIMVNTKHESVCQRLEHIGAKHAERFVGRGRLRELDVEHQKPVARIDGVGRARTIRANLF